MPGLIGLSAAIMVMIVAYELLPTAPGVRVRQLDRVASTEVREKLPFYRALLLPFGFLAKYTPAGQLEAARIRLFWAQRAGSWAGWDAVSFVSLRLAAATAFAVIAAPRGAMILAVAAYLGWWLPDLFLAGKSRRSQRAFRRELPEAVQLLSMLVSVGRSLPEALREISGRQGVVSAWLREVMAAASGRSLVVVLEEKAAESGLEPLVRFAANLRLIEEKGTGAVELFDGLARDMVQSYRAETMARARKISTELVFPILAFYFLPYLGALLAPMAVSVMGLFAGGR